MAFSTINTCKPASGQGPTIVARPETAIIDGATILSKIASEQVAKIRKWKNSPFAKTQIWHLKNGAFVLVGTVLNLESKDLVTQIKEGNFVHAPKITDGKEVLIVGTNDPKIAARLQTSK